MKYKFEANEFNFTKKKKIEMKMKIFNQQLNLYTANNKFEYLDILTKSKLKKRKALEELITKIVPERKMFCKFRSINY